MKEKIKEIFTTPIQLLNIVAHVEHVMFFHKTIPKYKRLLKRQLYYETLVKPLEPVIGLELESEKTAIERYKSRAGIH